MAFVRTTAILTLLATLGGEVAAAERPAEAGILRRAYFRAETPDARRHVAPFVTHEFPDGIIGAVAPPRTLEELAASPGLILVGFEAVYHPVPIAADVVDARTTRPHAAAGTARPCYLPDFIPAVGWGIRAVYEDPSLIRPSGGAGVRVGVLDSGVSPHLDVVRRLAKCVDLTLSPGLSPCADSMGHGTMVASIIAADGGFDGLGMHGVAPEAWIYSYRVCEPTGECWGSYIAAAIYAAIADSVNIINLSLVGSNDEVVRAAIDSAVAHNILVVAAAGNSPPFSYVGYPAAHPEVVSVGAITESYAPWPYSTSGLNDGDYIREEKEIEFAAPGSSVLAAHPRVCYVLGSGTSLAAPHVAGLAAKLWNGDAAATRGRLQGAARLHDLHVAGDDTLTGFGLPTIRPVIVITARAGPGGTVNPSGGVPVAPGAAQAFTIGPSDNCHLIQDVKVDGVSQGPISNYTFTDVTADHTIRATFSTLGPFAIDASVGLGGTISPNGSSSVGCGGSQTYTIASDNCHAIQDVKVDGVSRGPISSYTFTDVRAGRTIHATFSARGPFTISASAGSGGTISPSGASSVACGGSRSYTIAPSNNCQTIQRVTVDGVSRGAISSYTFTDVTAGHTIQATFSARGPFTISASAGSGGTISPSGASSVACGGGQSYTIAPSGCHGIQSVSVDGHSQGAISNYAFTNVTTYHTISATFSALGFALHETHTGVGWIADGSIDLTVAGGVPPYTYDWSHGATSQDVAALAAGAYTVRVTDARGCTASLTVTIASSGNVELALGRPAPNPAPGPVRLRYGIPAQTAIRVSVVDLRGREVAVLAQGIQPAGWSWAIWNGETDRGRAPSGVYFIRLETGGRHLVQRFALIR